jgi:hypothetical protein
MWWLLGMWCWQFLSGGERVFARINFVQFNKTSDKKIYSPIFMFSRPWSTMVGSDIGRKNVLEAIDVVSSGV